MSSQPLEQEINLYVAHTLRSNKLQDEASRYMPGGSSRGTSYFDPYPIFIDHGQGHYVYDVDHNQYLDFMINATSLIMGHAHPSIVQALQRQVVKGTAFSGPTEAQIRLAKILCDRLPSVDTLRFTNSGTEGTMMALRLARAFTGRHKMAKFEGGYHGSHDVVEVSVGPPLDKAGQESAPISVPTAGGMSPHAAEEVVVLPYNDQGAVERLVQQHREELACVIFDPKAGILPLREEFPRAVREITRQNDVLLVFDEIVGFRAGTGGLQEVYGIDPDLSTYGKTVGGGFPVGAFGGRADIMDLLDSSKGSTGFFQSGTFSAHPVVMAAGLAMLQQLTPEAIEHLNGLADRLCAGLNELFAEKGIAAQAINDGSVFSIYFTDEDLINYRSLSRTDKEMPARVFLALLLQGYFLSHGLGMNSLSLPMDTGHVDGLVEAMGKALDLV